MSTIVILLEHMHKKFEINRTKIKGSCQSKREVATHNSMSDFSLCIEGFYRRCSFGPEAEV